MRKKYFGEELVFAFIWDSANPDGIWDGDATNVAQKFGVSEAEAYSTLSGLCDLNRIQRIGTDKYIITRWRERDEPGEKDGEPY